MLTIQSFIGIAACLILSPTLVHAQGITLFAAASLTQPLNQIIIDYSAQTGIKVTPVYAASSTLARQIAYAAPADIYISANQKWMNYLIDQNKVQTNSLTTLLSNRLVLIAPSASSLNTLQLDQPQKITAQLADAKIAIADTDHVPVGIYAKQALKNLKLWQALKGKLALTANTRGALAFAEQAVVPLAIVYKTDAQSSSKVKILATFPQSSHLAIEYPIALIAKEQPISAAVLDFYRHLSSKYSAFIFQQHGFSTDIKQH